MALYLKETDYRLLAYLFHNHNEPISKVAKATSIPRNQVAYRLKKYTNEGLIRTYFPVIQYSRLGYKRFAVIFLKFETRQNADAFADTLASHPNCISYGKAYERYDLYLNCIFKDEQQANAFIEGLFEEENITIEDYEMIMPQATALYPLKAFGNYEKDSYDLSLQTEPLKNLDKLDEHLLSILAQTDRPSLVHLARLTGQASEKILYRLRRLKKENVILGNRIQFDMQRLGYSYATVFVNLHRYSKENKQKVKRYVKACPHGLNILFNIKSPHIIIQLFFKEHNELQRTLEELQDLLKNERKHMDVLLIKQEEQHIRPVPFLQ